MQNRVPKITNTMKDLGWKPKVNMDDALRAILITIARSWRRRGIW